MKGLAKAENEKKLKANINNGNSKKLK